MYKYKDIYPKNKPNFSQEEVNNYKGIDSAVIPLQNCKALQHNLRKNSYNYSLVLRGLRSFIFRQDVTPNKHYYEVFRKRVRSANCINGKIIPAREVFPGNEDFGKWAWSCFTYEQALKRFKEIEKITPKNKTS
jgi:Iap family predicted aminopeptidase